MLERDLDALVPVAPGYDGRFKVSLCGPWTLSATLELTRGARVAGDAGAVRDLVESCAATVAEHLAEVARRLPAAQLVLQLDEPALPAVLAGRLPTASKLGRVRAVPADTVADGLRHVVAAAGVPVVVHCCAPDVPVGLLATTGVTAVSFDPSAGSLDREALAAAADQGIGLWLGLVPPIEAPATPDRLADAGRRLWHELGVSPARLAADGAVTPSCGLAGATSAGAGTALQLAGQVARILAGVGEEASAR
jgi:methionine synthase II (cobalamin-independent)